MIKQVIVMRTDLNMRKGKMIAQGSHASMKVFFDRIVLVHSGEFFVDGAEESLQKKYDYLMRLTPEMQNWLNNSFTKIVVGCSSEQELFDLKKKADEAEIVNAIILDNGNTEFKEVCPVCLGSGNKKTYFQIPEKFCKCDHCNGTGKINKPTYTCLAIGPDEAEKIDKITGELKLL